MIAGLDSHPKIPLHCDSAAHTVHIHIHSHLHHSAHNLYCTRDLSLDKELKRPRPCFRVSIVCCFRVFSF